RDRRQHQLGVLAKIETLRGARAIGEILLEGLKHEPFGVMIARGDLAVELGPEYHAEIQEELLWVCEAAHVPVVWATQVLDRLAKKGTPSRPEITDAAASSRAECVMVNKGPYVDLAVMLLDEVLSRMAHHQHKKTPLLRALRIAQNIPSIVVDK
ncbi:MAG: pyruvate kinase, partial [Spirochaetes bacterium]|nr:pyruvate kinase [Spirochaetota bacterium]